MADQLPSVRALAEELVVNPNTVARAYTDLAREGLLESRPGRGVFITRKRKMFTREEGRRRLEPLLEGLIGEAMVMDVRPGTHVFRWQEFDRRPSPLGTITPLQLNIQGGTVLFLSNNITKGFAMEGGVINVDTMRVAADVKIVRPSSCPPTICL